MRKTWYYAEGSKKAELWTILHLPYTAMALSFLIIGFGIHKPIDVTALILISIAYFFGLGIGAHALDQLPSVKGSKYVKFLTPLELKIMGIGGLMVAFLIGFFFIFNWQAWHMIWLMFLQGLFAVGYPTSKPSKIFHTDTSFAFSFGFLPVAVGFYAANLSFSWLIAPFGLTCMMIARVEILLSRFSRKLRAEGADEKYLQKPETALKTLCMLSYLLAFTIYCL